MAVEEKASGVEEVHILWISEGMSCDGDTVSVTAASQPRPLETPKPGVWEAVGIAASIALAASVLFLPWFSLADTPTRMAGDGFVCGDGNLSCTAFATFPLMRWALLAIAAASPALLYVLLRGHAVGWPLGDITMMAGALGFVLVAYNGIVDRPGVGVEEAGISLAYGYVIALTATIAIALSGMMRAAEMGGQRARKPPGVL